jgi:hemerythrin-like metal-binding protein
MRPATELTDTHTVCYGKHRFIHADGLQVKSPMYYSYFSTGNVRIDSEHANIDCMVDLCRARDGDWIPSARVLVTALANHLDSEEKICAEDGLNMTAAHEEEHRQLKTRLTKIEEQVDNGEIEKEVFLSTFRDMLFYHISNFDKFLAAD